jgi:replicative DNA helicase
MTEFKTTASEQILTFFLLEKVVKDFISTNSIKYVSPSYLKPFFQVLIDFYLKNNKTVTDIRQIESCKDDWAEWFSRYITNGNCDEMYYLTVLDIMRKEWIENQRIEISQSLIAGDDLGKIFGDLDDVIRESNPKCFAKKGMIFEDIEEKINGIKSNRNIQLLKTGYPEFNDMVGGGLRRKKLYYFCGNTGSGKTRFISDFNYDMVANGHSGMYFTFEMLKEEIETLYIAKDSGVEIRHLDCGQVMDSTLKEVFEKIEKQKHKFCVIENINAGNPATPMFLSEEIIKHKKEYSLDYVIIDYVQQMVLPGDWKDKEHKMLNKISDMLFQMAVDFDITVIGLLQLNKTQKKGEPFDVRNIAGSYNMARPAEGVFGIMRTKVSSTLLLEPDKNRKGVSEPVEFFMDWQINRMRTAKTMDDSVHSHSDNNPF